MSRDTGCNEEKTDNLTTNKGGQPVTFGDVFIDSYTDKVRPRETVLTHPEDLCTQQRLDYIFLIEPKKGGETESDDQEAFADLQRTMKQEGYTSVGITPKRKKKVRNSSHYSESIHKQELIEKVITTVLSGEATQHQSHSILCEWDAIHAVVRSLWSRNDGRVL